MFNPWPQRIHKVDWGPGYRFFECEDCGHQWKEESRHCQSPSSEPCRMFMEDQCENYNGVYPHGHEKHYEWPTDESGNLIRKEN